jgi:hypothetical protein
MSFGSPPSPPPLAPLPPAPAPAPLMGTGQGPGQKPQPKSAVPTFISEAMQSNPTNTGNKTLTGT